MADLDPRKYAWTEPESASKAQYPYDNVMQTESGHFQEFDDTLGAERIRTQHRAGTYTEIRPDGTEVHKIVGEGFEVIVSNKKVSIGGFCTVTIAGDSVLEVQGDCYQRTLGNHKQVVEGNYDLSVAGKVNITSGGNMKIQTTKLGGKINFLAGERVVVDSDLVVNGGVSGSSLYSSGSVTAGTGIQAGVLGSLNPVAGISTLGGINVGIPPPTPTVPGVVNATVMVTAPAIIGTVITFGNILMDPLGGAPLIRTIYDTHTHIGNRGFPTSIPLQQMPLP
jgi:hypothetical protein